MQNKAKYTLITTLFVACVVGRLWAQEEPTQKVVQRDGWYTNLDVAKKLAVKEGKDLLIEFTRSEGCGWCVKLEKEVLSQDGFKDKVAKNYVMVVLNYPHDSSKWTAEVKAQHAKLLNHYQIRKFPYLVFADASGQPYESESYRDRKPEAYLNEIIEIQNKRNKRDKAFTAAKNAEGKEKARLLEKGMAEISRRYHRHYPEIIAEIAKADPDDTSGFMAKIRVDEVRAGLGHMLKPHYEESNYEAIPAAVELYISENNPKGEALQMALLYKVQALYWAKKFTSAKKLADEVIAINGTTRAARYASSIKKRVERVQAEGK